MSLSPQTSFLIQLLQFSALLTLRHDRSSGAYSSPSSITSRRQANDSRAGRWREAARNDAFPSQLLNIYSSAPPEIGKQTARHGAGKDNTWSQDDGTREGDDGLQARDKDKKAFNRQTSNGERNENSARNSFRNLHGNSLRDTNENAKGRHEETYRARADQEQESRPTHEAAGDKETDFITLLDLLPMFMDVTAAIMSTSLHEQSPSTPSSPAEAAMDDQDKSSTTSEMVWASAVSYTHLTLPTKRIV